MHGGGILEVGPEFRATDDGEDARDDDEDARDDVERRHDGEDRGAHVAALENREDEEQRANRLEDAPGDRGDAEPDRIGFHFHRGSEEEQKEEDVEEDVEEIPEPEVRGTEEGEGSAAAGDGRAGIVDCEREGESDDPKEGHLVTRLVRAIAKHLDLDALGVEERDDAFLDGLDFGFHSASPFLDFS